MPGPDANTEYHSVSFATSFDLPKFCVTTRLSASDSSLSWVPSSPLQLPFMPMYMASPVVAGIAALVLEYYPNLTAKQLKYVIEHSVTKFPSLIVKVPGGDDKAAFSTLSVTGGIVNAYNALKLASTLKGERIVKK